MGVSRCVSLTHIINQEGGFLLHRSFRIMLNNYALIKWLFVKPLAAFRTFMNKLQPKNQRLPLWTFLMQAWKVSSHNRNAAHKKRLQQEEQASHHVQKQNMQRTGHPGANSMQQHSSEKVRALSWDQTLAAVTFSKILWDCCCSRSHSVWHSPTPTPWSSFPPIKS